jgi:hypothetical protein
MTQRCYIKAEALRKCRCGNTFANSPTPTNHLQDVTHCSPRLSTSGRETSPPFGVRRCSWRPSPARIFFRRPGGGETAAPAATPAALSEPIDSLEYWREAATQSSPRARDVPHAVYTHCTDRTSLSPSPRTRTIASASPLNAAREAWFRALFSFPAIDDSGGSGRRAPPAD